MLSLLCIPSPGVMVVRHVVDTLIGIDISDLEWTEVLVILLGILPGLVVRISRHVACGQGWIEEGGGVLRLLKGLLASASDTSSSNLP